MERQRIKGEELSILLTWAPTKSHRLRTGSLLSFKRKANFLAYITTILSLRETFLTRNKALEIEKVSKKAIFTTSYAQQIRIQNLPRIKTIVFSFFFPMTGNFFPNQHFTISYIQDTLQNVCLNMTKSVMSFTARNVVNLNLFLPSS